MKYLAIALLVVGIVFAGFTIPAGQPICNLYGMIQTLGTVAGVIVAAYAGFVLASSHEQSQKNAAKALLGEVILGLIIIWIAPLIVESLVNSGSICGW